MFNLSHAPLLVRVLAILAMASGVAYAIEPVTQLGERAERILVGSSSSMSVADDGSVQFTIQPVAALKGDLPPLSVVVRLSATQPMRQTAHRIVRADAAAYGLWFVGSATGDGVYELLPTKKGGDYTEASAAYISIPQSWSPDPSQSRDQQLLSALAAGYQVSPRRAPDDDFTFFVSLENARPEDARAIALDFMNSGAVDQQVVGVIAGLRLGLDESLAVLSDRLGRTRYPDFGG